MKKINLLKLMLLMLVSFASIGNIYGGTRWVYLSLKESRGDYWESAGARFALYAYTCASSSGCGTSAWYDLDLIDSGDNRVYAAEIDDKYKGVIFCRMNGSTTENNWTNKWSQTGDCTLPTGDNANNCLYLKKWDEGSYWAYYWDPNTVVYVDFTNLNMTYGNWGSNVWFRVGHGSANSAWKVNNSSVNKVNGTKSLYKMSSGAGWLNYTKFYLANNCGDQSSGKGIDYSSSKGSGDYLITQQAEAISSRSTTSRAYTIIPNDPSSSGYTGGDGCYYYTRQEYNFRKTYTITNTAVANAEMVLYYWDESNVMQTVAEGSSAQVLPTTKVWCRVRPDDGYALRKVNLHDPGEREWTDASREDGGFEKNCYVVRTDVSFEAVIEPYATKTILVKDVNSWGPDHMYIKGWNPFLYEEYDNAQYHYTTQKVSNKITLCGYDYYVITISNEFPFYYIHNEGDGVRTAFFATNRLNHMAKYDDYTSGDGDWGLRTAPCNTDPIYWVETYKGSGPKYISNIVSNTTDTLSFYVESGATVDFHSGGSDPVNQYSSVFAKYFGGGGALNGKAGGVFTATTTGSALTNDAIFDGDYHIHVNAKTRNYLNAGGVSKPGTTGTKFIPFDKSSLFGDTFDHYWVDWFLGSGDGQGAQSVVASVGNKYNANLAGILGADAFAPKGMTQAAGGNVRYGYDPETNHFERAIVASGDAAIQIQSNTAVTDNDSVMVSSDGGSTYTQNATTARYFADATNWNYQVYAKVRGGSHATAKTSYVAGTQTLASQKQLIGGSGSEQYVVVLTYDFKTNRFIAAWKPAGDFEGFDLESNLMIIRTEDGNPTVLNIVDKNSDGKVTPLTKITKMYTVLELLQDNWKSDEATYSDNPYAKRRVVSGDYIDEYYWISLPYECLVKDIFGIEDYGSNGSWVMQTYRGDLRAEKGWWAETNAWWYDMDRSDTLKAHEGYVLRVTNLNEDYRGSSGISKKFKGSSGGKLSLYFPSEDNELTIAPLTGTVRTHLDSLKCTKWHKQPKTDKDTTQGENNPLYDRRAIDSNWRIIGSPSFNSTKISAPEFITTSADANKDGYVSFAEYQAFVEKYIEDHDGATPFSLKYFYDWEVVYEGLGRYETKFTIANAATTEFKGTHAHLVQYAGDITWVAYDGSNPLVGITNKAPKRQQEEATEEQTLRLVLKQGTHDADIAYISRMAFGATMGYDLNMDLSKMINANSANIYTMGELYKMAGNCIPDTVTILPVGVQLAADGDYTFAMPEGTYGTGVVLLDKVTDKRTNLALTDYTVNLPAGTYEERFVLELSPVAQVPTDIESISAEGLAKDGAHKVMVDGVLYIVKDGKVFDAQGNRVQ